MIIYLFQMKPGPVKYRRTLQWLERQVMPSIVMIEEIDRLTGSNYMKMIDGYRHLSEKHEDACGTDVYGYS